jgi:signal transduction histidine kinase
VKKLLIRFRNAFFAPQLDLRVRLFHVLAIGGTITSLLMGLFGFVGSSGFVNITFNLAAAALSYSMLIYTRRTGRYQACYLITIIVIFMGLFPVLFFWGRGGGYHSGMPAFFVFAVAFTVFMLEGKRAVIFSLAELVLYTAICLIAYNYPQTVNAFAAEREVLIAIIIGFTTVSVVLGLCMLLHFRLYNEQQKKLDEQNAVLAQTSRAKTEFLANASHEMRTPLTIISVNVQTAIEIMEDMGVAEKESGPSAEAGKLLQTAQDEIMRLARMVGGMLTLASISEGSEKEIVEFTALLSSSAEMLRLSLQKRRNTLAVDIETGLRVFGNADLLAPVMTNLLQNAGKYTENGTITLSAKTFERTITVTVGDTGTGIPAELLPRVFERSVSGDRSTGYGLYLCKAIVESHGGRIWIESGRGSGTAVHFSLPDYEGQFGGSKE